MLKLKPPRRVVFGLVFSLLTTMVAERSYSQQSRPERTLEEIKTEAIKRAENGMYPLIGLDPADVRQAFQSIKTKDKDEWAAAFLTARCVLQSTNAFPGKRGASSRLTSARLRPAARSAKRFPSASSDSITNVARVIC